MWVMRIYDDKDELIIEIPYPTARQSSLEATWGIKLDPTISNPLNPCKNTLALMMSPGCKAFFDFVPIDPNIERDALIELLRAAWAKHPDQRLCQFIVNVTKRDDPFFVNDGALAEKLARIIDPKPL